MDKNWSLSFFLNAHLRPSLHPQVVSWVSSWTRILFIYIIRYKNRIIYHVFMSSCHVHVIPFWLPGFSRSNRCKPSGLTNFKLGWERCWRCCLAFARLCQILHHFDCQPWGSQSMMSKLGVWFWKKNTFKNPKLWRNHCWIVRLILQPKKKGTNHLNPSQNTGIVLWKKRVQQNRTHSFSGQGRFSKRSPASSSSFLAKQSWYLRLKKWAPNSMYGTSGQGLL